MKEKELKLTEEWLYSVGFGDNNWSRHAIQIDMDGAWLCLDCCDEKDVFITVSIYDEIQNCAVYLRPLNYIHEVKSLYFLLTEEELTPIEENETLSD
jgi:hypothetical protein